MSFTSTMADLGEAFHCALIRSCAALGLLVLGSTMATATPWNHVWPPAASTADVLCSVPISATTVVSPPSITLNFIKAGTYQIFRKDPAATTWGTAVTTTPASTTSYTDTNVVVGQLYEYKCILTDGPQEEHIPNPITYAGGNGPPDGYIVSGINVDETQPRGRVVVVVANDVPTNLPTEYNQYISDLQADGWYVHIISVTPVPISPVGYDVGGTNACATISVTAGGTGYVSGTTGTTDATGDFRFTDTTTNSEAFATITVSSGVITAATVATGGAGGGFNVGDTLTISNVASGTGSGATFKVGSVQTVGPNPAPIRAAIQAIYNQYPGQVKDLVILGRVPACRTSSTIIGDPDGHEVNDGATGADGYYANMTGTWTDTGSNASNIPYEGVTLSTGEINTPHDGKFDQYYMSQTGGEADLGFGRIDLSDGITAQYEALKAYLRKLHRFKTCSPDFLPGRRIILREGDFENVDGTCWGMAYGVTGSLSNIDCIASADLPTEVSPSFDADADYSSTHGPYLFYFKGNGGPGIGIGGQAVFWTGCQSHWGWWYSSTVSSDENGEALRLGENSFGLSWTWDIFGTRYFYHRMSMGFDAGDMMRVSVNNVDSTNGTYAFVTDPATTDGGYIAACTGSLWMNHIGDPTLRFFMVAPPTNLSVVPNGSNQPGLTWTPSTDGAVIGYHVYRAPLSSGAITSPYTRLTSSPVVGTTYTDTDPTAGHGTGQWSYLVRAIKLETTGSGTFYNASLGTIQSIDQTNGPTALAITSPATLPDCNWNTAYTTTLTASGGTPNYTWSVVSGTVPPGLTLSPAGAFTGTPTTGGTYGFTAKVVDALGQNTQQAFTLTTDSPNTVTLIPEASAYTISTAATRIQGPTESDLISPTNYTFLRFNVSSLSTNNALVSAKLRIYDVTGTTTNSISLTETGLTPDASVNWSMATLCWNNQPSDNPAVPATQATVFPVPLNYVDIDVTQQLAYALANNTTGKFGVRLFTSSPSQTIVIGSSYSYAGAIPQLIIQTTNAPKITITSPTMNPAFVYTGSGLAITATVTPIPSLTGSVTQQWSQVSGPGTTTFSTPTQPNTTATFSAPGTYVLQLAANDTVLQSSQQLTVRVLAAPVTGPTDSLVLRLPFDETSGNTAFDASGSGNNGTLINGPTWTSPGEIGGAVLLANSNQQVDVADSSTHQMDGQQAMTFSCWFNATGPLDSDGSFRNILVKSGAFTIQLRGSEVYTTVALLQEDNFPIVAGKWYHVALVYDGSVPNNNNQRTYINGVPVFYSNSAATGVTRKSTSPLLIGAGTTTDTHAFNGMIDEVRIYNRALSLAEIQDLAAAAPSNMGPVITTNPSIGGPAGASLPLTATVTDDGKPAPSTLTYNWSEVNGPSTLTINSPGSYSASTTPGTPGSYALQFTASDGAITTFANVAATITGQTYSTWAASNGLTGNNALQTAIIANDGLNNLYKYALGLVPTTNYNSGNPALPSVKVNAGNYLTLTFTGNATDVTYKVQATSSLSGSWTTIATWPSGSGAPGTQTVQDTQTINASNSRFLRLQMSIP